MRLGRHSYEVVKWTGREKGLEYWECNACFEEAAHLGWLEEMVEKLYGARCKDYEAGCPCCQAWAFTIPSVRKLKWNPSRNGLY